MNLIKFDFNYSINAQYKYACTGEVVFDFDYYIRSSFELINNWQLIYEIYNTLHGKENNQKRQGFIAFLINELDISYVIC